MLDRNTKQQHLYHGNYRRENVSFSDITSLLKANVATFAACLVASLAIGTAYLFLAEPRYTGQTQMIVDTRLPQILRDPNAESSAAPEGVLIETHMVSLRSRTIASDVIARLGLAEDDTLVAGRGIISTFLQTLGNTRDGSSVTQDAKIWNAVEKFQDKVVVERVGVSNIINIRYTARDSETAAKIANEIAQSYIRSLVEVRANAARSASEWLEERIAKLRVQMNAAARRVQQFRARQDFRIGSNSTTDSAGASGEPATLEELELTADTYRKIYQNFYTAFAEAVQRESYPSASVRVIAAAEPPQRPSSPKALPILAIAVAIGGAIALALSVLRSGGQNVARLQGVRIRKDEFTHD